MLLRACQVKHRRRVAWHPCARILSELTTAGMRRPSHIGAGRPYTMYVTGVGLAVDVPWGIGG
jgi:hypothetical protein